MPSLTPPQEVTQAELDNARDYLDRDNGQAGMYIAGPAQHLSRALSTLTAGRAYAIRFVPSRDMAITKIAFYVSTAAGADDACDVGIYDAALTTKLVSKGATTGLLNSTGLKEVTVTSTPLTAGTTYYAAFSVVTPFGGTAANVIALNWGIASGGTFFGTTAGAVEIAYKAASHPLPTSLGGFSTDIGSGPLLALRES